MTAVLEIRTYRATPGTRDRMLDILRSRAFPAQRRLGIRILGPFASAEDEDTFYWIRGFPSEEVRAELTDRFYGGREWLEDLEPVILAMLADHRAVVAEDTVGLWDRWPEEAQ